MKRKTIKGISVAEYFKAYYEANKDKIAEQRKAYYEANKDKIKAYREANKDKIAEQRKAYREANKDKIKAYYEANKDKIAEKHRQMHQREKTMWNNQTKEEQFENMMQYVNDQLNDNGGTNFTKSSADDFPKESLISVKRESADSPNSPHDSSAIKEEANFS